VIDAVEWLHGFVLPLVAGGDVRVRGALGAVELKHLLDRLPDLEGAAAAGQVAEARLQVAAELWLDAQPPPLDDTALRLALSVQNLLFLAHPGAQTLSVSERRRRRVARYALMAAALHEPRDFEELVARHTLVHHLFDLGRDDVRISFWAGRREYRGAEPPGRLLKWPNLRRVREERWRVGVVAEAISDNHLREVVNALVLASPLTDLLEPTRLEPRFTLGPIVKWLRLPQVARGVADRYLALGLEQSGPAFGTALVDLYQRKEMKAESKLATRFFCHLHLLWLLGEAHSSEPTRRTRVFTMASHNEAMKDFFGLFAAAQRIGLGRPPDVARDPRLAALVDSHTVACSSVCGPARVLQLEGLLARGVGELALAS
jgi:hypothetical protein